ncbi:hypothetical protein D3C75_681160 [compost metagenome]
MRLGFLALAILAPGLAFGSNNLPPSPENIAATYKDVAIEALKKEAAGDIRMSDFRLNVFIPDNHKYKERYALVYMCGRIAGRDSASLRSADEPVYVWGSVGFSGKAVTEGARISEVVFVNRINNNVERIIANRVLNTRCLGKDISRKASISAQGDTFTTHVIDM